MSSAAEGGGTGQKLLSRTGSVHSQRSSVAPEGVFGTAPQGVIGRHKPREMLRVERDYSAGELCQFWSGWIWELDGRISPTDFQNTLNDLNTVLASAHDPYKSCGDNCLAILTLYLSPRIFGSHYEREMAKFDRILQRANRDVYNPAGLNILSPRRTAFLFRSAPAADRSTIPLGPRQIIINMIFSRFPNHAEETNTCDKASGPATPVGDFIDPTINGNGKGFRRLIEDPAVTPKSDNPTNNINVISLAYVPGGMSVHFQTPFGIGAAPVVHYGTNKTQLNKWVKGYTTTYGRTPSCSQITNVTQCSEFFHNVQITGLEHGKEYYYTIPGGNGTTPSDVLSFKTALNAGNKEEFTVAIVNDMGYTNAYGTHKQLIKAVEDGAAFAWHGGDLSYADDWYEGILECSDTWDVCYNGSSTRVPGGITPEYNVSLPAGEIANQGGPLGGDSSVIYESNWDIWQQWMGALTKKVPYMVLPGNHEAACAEFDGDNNELTALLVDGLINGTSSISNLTYASCPVSERNFTAFQHRFRMPGSETGGVGNFWYSFDYGSAHFVSFSGETDYYQSPESPLIADLTGNETHPLLNETYITDSGPFGYINGSYKINENYEQYQWLKNDLESVDRSVTPWVIAMSHRPMYSTEVSSYQLHMRNAFEQLFLDNNVDAYISGHIHWNERLKPMARNGTIAESAIVSDHVYKAAKGHMYHGVNGQGGNIESHSTLGAGESISDITAFLDQNTFGFTKLIVYNETVVKFEFIRGTNGTIGDYVYLVKE